MFGIVDVDDLWRMVTWFGCFWSSNIGRCFGSTQYKMMFNVQQCKLRRSSRFWHYHADMC